MSLKLLSDFLRILQRSQDLTFNKFAKFKLLDIPKKFSLCIVLFVALL